MASETKNNSVPAPTTKENDVEDSKNAAATVVETPPPSLENKIKIDWYQSDSDVVVNILAKGIKKEDTQVDFGTDQIVVKFPMPTGEMYNRTLKLFKAINTERCSTKVMSTKIELRLRKTDASAWKSLEAVEIKSSEAANPPSYPSSSKIKKDWDKIDKELSKEKDEESDVNTLFSKIFESGDDNTRKAMIKSMQESGGTVLSTNWEEVGKKKVDMSPPDGMEFKKWE